MTEKCSICNIECVTKDERDARKDRIWDEREIISHKINHIEDGKVKRIVATFMEIPEEKREKVLDFIDKYLSG